ncbi:MAG: hypothetical protein QF472_00675 [Candidatus Marinimicrobia bacterium]|jgi:hypothetical protein|nr:hypothetical protein [Candidatus Neomarinimicrobiota bacterium]MDP6852442.1 hypothetical protein [Candidatus Neomarinimicrobiota bacterium]
MNLLKLIAFIVIIWFVYQIRKFISGIRINKHSANNTSSPKNTRKNLDIQDAEFEDIP